MIFIEVRKSLISFIQAVIAYYYNVRDDKIN